MPSGSQKNSPCNGNLPVQESGQARYWLGFSLIGMTVFFLLIGISQILDISSHRIGH